MKYYSSYLSHHQILGAKWGKLNGPPYPLGKGDHSASEKRAAEKAGVKVGKDSGKGSIDNVKGASGSNQHAKKAPLTEEEKRLKAEEAQLKGDSKNITKYMDKMTTQELQDAETRARIRKNLEGPQEKKMTKSEKEIDDAIKSGDKEKVKQYADKMTTYQLQDAMNKIDLLQKLNYEPPKPTTMDKIDNAMKKVDKARDWMQKGLNAYDALAAINNTFNKDSQWPRPKKDNNDKNDKKDEKKKDDFLDKAKKAAEEVSKTKAENDERQANAYAKKAEADLKKQQYDDQRKDQKKAEKAAEKEEKEAKKTEKNLEKALEKSNKEDSYFDEYNRMLRMTDKQIDKELTANEDAMFKAVSDPSSYDSDGNFNWDAYYKQR